MAGPTNLGSMKTNEWEVLQDYADRFEQAWQHAATVDMAKFLPAPGNPLRALTLVELIKTDLEIRWRRGQIMGLESYLERFPELGSVSDLPASLLYEEYRVRHVHGDKPLLDVYRSRFPQQFTELNRLVKEQPPVPSPTATVITPTLPFTGGSASNTTNTAGQLIGNGYKVIERIGSGGFAEVYRAEAPGGIEVAVKIMVQPMSHAEARREFQSLDLIKRLRHPYLLQTQAYWVQDDRLYIVMDLAEGSLRSRLKQCHQEGKTGIPAPELLVYMKEAAEGLDFLHSEKVLHRDIKPDNILVLQRHAKVADFGLARLQKNQALASATNSGTPAYMAPEMWSGKVSEHTDQYCLAITYAELRLDRRVFAGGDLVSLMMQHLQGKPDLEGLPEAEQEVLARALAKLPADRYPSCIAFAQALEQALALTQAPPPSAQTTKKAWLPPSQTSASITDESLKTISPGSAGDDAPATEKEATEAGARSKGWLPARTRLVDRRQAMRRWLWIGGGLAAACIAGAVLANYLLTSEPTKAGPGVGPGVPVANPVFLPLHCRKADQARVVSLKLEGNKKCYDRIDYLLPDGTPIPFVLIPRMRDTDPRSFYMMVNKVSVDLFQKVAASKPYQQLLAAEAKGKAWVAPGKWPSWVQDWKQKLGDEALRLPIMKVTVIEAYCFARTLEGQLPGANQWDKAAGRFDLAGRTGPFIPPWNKKDRSAIAVGRKEEEGPLPVGTATADESVFHCRDMAGNGWEWTRDLENRKEPVPLADPHQDTLVTQRGRNYHHDRPLTFRDIENRPVSGGYAEARTTIGFRVMIEVD